MSEPPPDRIEYRYCHEHDTLGIKIYRDGKVVGSLTMDRLQGMMIYDVIYQMFNQTGAETLN